MTTFAVDPTEHLGLAWHEAIRHAQWWTGDKNTQVQDDDILSEAYVGLVKAAKGYNPDAGVKFSTYATRVIRNLLWDWSVLRNRSLPCKYSVARHCLAIIRFREQHDRDPTIEELRELINRKIANRETYVKYLNDVEFFNTHVAHFSSFTQSNVGDGSDEEIVNRHKHTDRHRRGFTGNWFCDSNTWDER